MKSRVLVKRVRAQLEPPKGGFFSRDIFAELELYANRKELAAQIVKKLANHYGQHLSKAQMNKLVEMVRKRFEKDWHNPKHRLNIAPGAELVEAFFRHFGTSYEKTKDARRIANKMKREDFCPEINALLERIRLLTQPKIG